MLSYGPLCTEFYDLDKPTAPADAVRYYAARAKECGGPVLEPMCGSGRFLLPMLRLGIEVEGVDAAPAMLEACRRRATNEGLRASVHAQLLQSLSLPRRYRMAFIPSGSIGLIPSDDDLAIALTALRCHLFPGAPLLLELADMSGGQDSQTQPLPRIVKCDERTTITYSCRISHAMDGSSLLFRGVYEKHRDARLVAREEEEIVLRQHRLEEFLLLLARCGYSRTQVLASDAYAGLGMSGCTLLEAHADA